MAGAFIFFSRREDCETLILSADSTSLRRLCAKVGEALWSAAACCRFPSGQLAGRAPVWRPWGGKAASKLAGSKRQQAAALQGAYGAFNPASVVMLARSLVLVAASRRPL
jgi:hypothetical protein